MAKEDVDKVETDVEIKQSIENTPSEFQTLTFEKLLSYYASKGLKRNLNQLKKSLSIVEATAQYLLDHNIKKIGLLATSGTIKGKVYDKVLNKYGIEAIVPDDQGQNEVMRLIYDCIKADKKPGDLSLLNSLLAKMEQSGSQACVLACTELPILFKEYLPDYNAIDATLILARAAIKEAGCKIKDI